MSVYTAVKPLDETKLRWRPQFSGDRLHRTESPVNNSDRWDDLCREFLTRCDSELCDLLASPAEGEELPSKQRLISVVHKIAGTGLSLGFCALGNQARRVELSLRAAPAECAQPLSGIRGQLDDLIQACRHLIDR